MILSTELFRKGLPKAEAEQLKQRALQNPALFASIMDIFLEGPTRRSQHAAGFISSCAQKAPQLLYPFLPAMLSQLKAHGVKDATKRNTLRILQYVTPPEAYEAELLDYCFNYLSDPKEPVAIKVFSMSILHQLSKKYPELLNELRVLLEDQLPFASPGFTSRARKILKYSAKNRSQI